MKTVKAKIVKAATRGETFPKVGVAISKDGDHVAVFCRVSVAWSGADPAVSKRRIDDAVKVTHTFSDKIWKADSDLAMARTPYKADLNSTKYQGVLQYTIPYGFRSSDPDLIQRFKEIAGKLGAVEGV